MARRESLLKTLKKHLSLGIELIGIKIKSESEEDVNNAKEGKQGDQESVNQTGIFMYIVLQRV